jgi:hypothetical protein
VEKVNLTDEVRRFELLDLMLRGEQVVSTRSLIKNVFKFITCCLTRGERADFFGVVKIICVIL